VYVCVSVCVCVCGGDSQTHTCCLGTLSQSLNKITENVRHYGTEKKMSRLYRINSYYPQKFHENQ